MRKERMIRYLSVSVLTFLFVLPAVSLVQAGIPFKQTTENPPTRITWIGILHGTWKEMGVQYGERAASDIRNNFDVDYYNEVVKYNSNNPWHVGRTDLGTREKYCLEYIRKGVLEFSHLSPEMIEFMHGIAEGAKAELDKCTYGQVFTNFDKIAFLQWGGLHFHPNAYCNGGYVKGEATKTGETYLIRAGQGGFTDSNARQVAYVAIPKDRQAQVYWAQTIAGAIALSGAVGIMNDYGVSAATAGAQYQEGYDQADETLAPGIKDFQLAAYAVIFSKSAQEAVEKFTIGTPKYRALTGRKTVLKARGSNVVFADPKEAYVVESVARHYAVRTPGYMGEKGKNYIVYANDFQYKDGSYDENNIFKAGEPMTGYCPQKPKSSTYYRFWTGMWNFYNKYGSIDREMLMRDIVAAHYAYDKDGTLYPVDSDGAPTVPGTFCAHSGVSSRTAEMPLGTGGNNGTSLMVLNTREVYWVSAWPCTFSDFAGYKKPWNYLDLKPYAKLRGLL